MNYETKNSKLMEWAIRNDACFYIIHVLILKNDFMVHESGYCANQFGIQSTLNADEIFLRKRVLLKTG
jgi:hypothetical protein